MPIPAELTHHQFHSGWHHNGSEAQRMWTDRSNQNGRHRGMYHGCTCSSRISRAARGCGHDQAIALHRRYVLAVQVNINVAQIGRWSAIDDHLVEHQNAIIVTAPLLAVAIVIAHWPGTIETWFE